MDEAASRAIDIAAIASHLSPTTRARIDTLEHFATIESTNHYLLQSAPPAAGRMRVTLADFQHAGRGRRGRRWLMPAGSGIALSAAWQFASLPRELTALGLATGAAARRAIRDAVGVEVGLKWPNDLMLHGGKAGGILVELGGGVAGDCHVVAGIGLNVDVPAGLLATLGDTRSGARDLAGALGGMPIDRSRLAASLIERLVELFAGFADDGFGPYRDEWLAAHVLAGRRVDLEIDRAQVSAVVCGIDADGALIVEDDAGLRRRIVSGDASVREHA